MVGCECEGLRRVFFNLGFEGETGLISSRSRSRLCLLRDGELDELLEEGKSGAGSR